MLIDYCGFHKHLAYPSIEPFYYCDRNYFIPKIHFEQIVSKNFIANISQTIVTIRLTAVCTKFNLIETLIGYLAENYNFATNTILENFV